MADDFALRVEQLECHRILGLLFQVVVENSAIGRVFADGITAAPKMSRARTGRGARREEMRVLGGDGSAYLAQRTEVIQNPERTAVGRDNQIVGMNNQIVDGCGGKVELERLPVQPVVKRNPNGGTHAGGEQPFAA